MGSSVIKKNLIVLFSISTIFICNVKVDAMHCRPIKYVVKGSVISWEGPKQPDSAKSWEGPKPADNAKMIIFFDYHSVSYIDGQPITELPDFFFTIKDGTYKTTAYYSPDYRYKFLLWFGACTEKPTTIEVIVIKKEHKTVRERFGEKEFRKFKVIDEGNQKIIILPEIKLSRIRQ